MTEIQNKNGVTFDIDAIATDLNGKMDKDGLNATCPVIVETYQSGTSWYRIYSDGWCEQGGLKEASGNSGTVTITLMKTMANTNYTIITSDIQDGVGSGSSAVQYYNKATASFNVSWTAKALAGFYWTVSGYIGETN